MQRQQTVVDCPRSMVGRVIGKGGETIKALQQYTGAMIQIDQSCEPTKVTVAGSAQSLQLAVSMVRDIVAGNFKGFALLRQLTSGTGPQLPQGYEHFNQAQPVYVEGYGFVPPSQVWSQATCVAAFCVRAVCIIYASCTSAIRHFGCCLLTASLPLTCGTACFRATCMHTRQHAANDLDEVTLMLPSVPRARVLADLAFPCNNACNLEQKYAITHQLCL